MTERIVSAKSTQRFLSEVFNEIPSNCLLNKGITGCGGTTLELESKRNSIILVPNINLVLNKCNSYPNLIGVYGDVTQSEFNKKLKSQTSNIKIMATYDALNKLITWIGNDVYDYFLLIDEYHILFNSYDFRYKAISYILQNYHNFKNFCFMTATPLKEYNILEEIKMLDRIIVEWPCAVPVQTELRSAFFTSKEVVKEIEKSLKEDYNLHIFINSLNTIRSIVKNISTDNFRTICSKEAQKKDLKNGGRLKVSSINSPVQKVNFYTATAFEGVDIYDPKGKTIVISDTNVAQSLIDISTLYIQICGRLRDSIYKDQVLFICNVGDHRYLKHNNQKSFDEYSNKTKELAVEYGIEFNKASLNKQKIDKDSYENSPEFYRSRYIGLNGEKMDFDPNLQKIDYQNFNVITKIFNNTINVIHNLKQSKIKVKVQHEKLLSKIYKMLPNTIVPTTFVEKKIFPIIEKQTVFCSWEIFYKIFGPYVNRAYLTLNGKRQYVIDFSGLKFIDQN